MSSKEGTKNKPRKRKKRVYPATKNFECEECGKRFYFLSKLKYHQMVHTGEKPYVCKTCGKGFNSPHSLKGHEYIHSNSKPFKCSFCAYACRDSSTLRKHENNMHMDVKKSYQCKICCKTYKQKARLKMHVAETHLELDMHRIPCQHCGKRFKTNSNLTVHTKLVHDRKKTCECPICGKILTNSGNLPNHLLTHSDVRPYKCTFEGCLKRFKDSSTLQKHIKTHTPEAHIPCDLCDKLFTRAERLTRHVITVHAKRKTVECDYCGVKFYSKNYLITHIRRKHATRRTKFKCDMCRFSTYNKPSLVMHIKYGHVSENDKKCRICKTKYKKHAYLKQHYRKTHGLIYKTKQKQKAPKIKEEIIEKEEFDETSIDLFEIEKHELESDQQALDPQLELINTELKEYIVNDEQIKYIPDAYFQEFYIDCVDQVKNEREPTKYKANLDEEAHNIAKETVQKMVVEARQKQAKQRLEEARRMYNERIKELIEQTQEPIKVKMFKKNTSRKSNDQDDVVTISENDPKIDEQVSSNNHIPDKEPAVTETHPNINENYDESKNIEKGNEVDDQNDKGDERNAKVDDTMMINKINTRKRNIKARVTKIDDDDGNMSMDDENDKDDEDYEEKTKRNKTNKLILNSHQCYVCFKLYSTKEELLEHCQIHFDVCTETTLKKCPLCEYVTKLNITRHLKLVHKVNVKLPYTKLKDKLVNTDTSRYYYEFDDPNFKTMEVIPSVKNLNKIASMNVDKKNRVNKANAISKTKLVRKGKEWIVETEKVELDKNIILPEFNIETLSDKIHDDDTYFDSLKKLYHLAKKSDKKMLFPCQKCDKICQNLAALKLHYRKHDPKAKPFRAKVWKHKLKFRDDQKNTKTSENSSQTKINTENRTAKPNPITHKHKCDEELKQFYLNNIRGSDIEFWQFLKIYNKIDRDNITDFDDLKDNYDYGIEHHENNDKSAKGDSRETMEHSTESTPKDDSRKHKTKSGLSKNQVKTTKKIKRITKTKRVVKNCNKNIEIQNGKHIETEKVISKSSDVCD